MITAVPVGRQGVLRQLSAGHLSGSGGGCNTADGGEEGQAWAVGPRRTGCEGTEVHPFPSVVPDRLAWSLTQPRELGLHIPGAPWQLLAPEAPARAGIPVCRAGNRAAQPPGLRIRDEGFGQNQRVERVPEECCADGANWLFWPPWEPRANSLASKEKNTDVPVSTKQSEFLCSRRACSL